jgi:Cof subfamily protein (haloacid dehalogenase superfamily)
MMMIVSEVETKKLAAEFPQLSITRSSPYSVDIISRGMSKLKGIEKAGEYYGFTTDQVMAFGDSTNDVEMLAGVRFSVAMGNGSKKVKDVASYVTASNNEDGIYQAALHFGLMEEASDVSE